MLPWDLEDWITDAGADVLDKRLADATSLTPAESVVYEIWLLDTEARNGGLSQYFCNHGLEQWVACQAATQAFGLPSFGEFANAVNVIIGATEDPYEAIQAEGDPAENLWYSHQTRVVQELRELVTGKFYFRAVLKRGQGQLRGFFSIALVRMAGCRSDLRDAPPAAEQQDLF